MERVIDRKDYRRSALEESKITETEKIDIIQKKIRKVLLQSMGVAVILLLISFLKFFHCEELLSNFEELLAREISFSSISKDGQRLFDEAVKYYTKLDMWVNKFFSLEKIEEDIKKSGEINLVVSNEFLQTQESNNLRENKGKTSGEINVTEKVNFAEVEINSNFENNQENLENNNISGDNKVTNYKEAVEGMNQMLEDAKYINDNYETIIPVVGTITSEFGVRNSTNPIVSKYHSGLDIAANTGTQILAAMDGKVIEVGNDTYLGKYFKVQKEDIIMSYAHCSKLLVKKGDSIKKGALIAYVGNTGNSTGPHLHFEVTYKNRLINPKDILDI